MSFSPAVQVTRVLAEKNVLSEHGEYHPSITDNTKLSGQVVNNAGLNDGPTSSITDGIRNVGISPSYPRPESYTDGASAIDGFK